MHRRLISPNVAGNASGAFAVYFRLALPEQAGLLRRRLRVRTACEQESSHDDSRQHYERKTPTRYSAPLHLSAVT